MTRLRKIISRSVNAKLNNNIVLSVLGYEDIIYDSCTLNNKIKLG